MKHCEKGGNIPDRKSPDICILQKRDIHTRLQSTGCLYIAGKRHTYHTTIHRMCMYISSFDYGNEDLQGYRMFALILLYGKDEERRECVCWGRGAHLFDSHDTSIETYDIA